MGERGNSRRERCIHIGAPCDIKRECHCLTSKRFDASHGVVRLVREIGQRDIRAGFGQRQSNTAPDAYRAARDECRLAREIAPHGSVPFSTGQAFPSTYPNR